MENANHESPAKTSNRTKKRRKKKREGRVGGQTLGREKMEGFVGLGESRERRNLGIVDLDEALTA